jgi:predicted small metal-binding protein
MTKVIECDKVAPESGCHHVVRGANEEEVMRNVAEHARKDHGMEPTPELVAKARAQMHDE